MSRFNPLPLFSLPARRAGFSPSEANGASSAAAPAVNRQRRFWIAASFGLEHRIDFRRQSG